MARNNKKLRLDERLVRDGLAADLSAARGLVMSGQVVVGDHRHDKAGSRFADDVPVRLKQRKRSYVSRAGDKLAGALRRLTLQVDGLLCVDIGASTGGFTDCLLQHGANGVCAVDVGYGLLDGALRNDQRVVLLERCNAKMLTREQLPWSPGLITIDVSFIAVRALLPALTAVCDESSLVLAMVKPQFELPRDMVPDGGVVRDDSDRYHAADLVSEVAHKLGWHECGRCDNEVTGPAGNRELFILLKRQAP